MARVMFALFADRVSVDRFNNVLDVHTLIEQVQIPEPPTAVQQKARKAKQHLAVAGRLTLLIHWRRAQLSVPEHKLVQRVQLFGPKGASAPLASSEQEFTLREFPYARNLVGFEGLPIAGEGTYTAVISLKSGNRWRRVGEASFELLYLKPNPAGAKVRLH